MLSLTALSALRKATTRNKVLTEHKNETGPQKQNKKPLKSHFIEITFHTHPQPLQQKKLAVKCPSRFLRREGDVRSLNF
jgi:hypothetical protein